MPNGKVNNKEIYERITKVETDMVYLRRGQDEIKDNHLAHIAEQIRNLEKRFDELDKRLWKTSLSAIVLFSPLLVKESRDAIIGILGSLLGF